MNSQRIQQLFAVARRATPPEPDPAFAARTLQAIQTAPPPAPVSLLDQLEGLFPRLGLAAAVLIGLCVVVELGGAALDEPSLTSEVAQLSEQWLFSTKGF